MPGVAIALDVSISMARAYGDLSPSKLDAAVEAIAAVSRRLVEARRRVGLVLFAGWALPLIYPVSDAKLILRSLRYVNRTYEGSAPGDAIVEGVRMLRPLQARDRRIVLVTDGEYNMGVPLEHAIVYALNSGMRLDMVVIGGLEGARLAEVGRQFGESIHWWPVKSKGELYQALLKSTGAAGE